MADWKLSLLQKNFKSIKMKQIVSAAALFGLIFLLTSAITFMDSPQDPPKKAKKHISLVLNENGDESKIDTIISADQVFVWHGDTIGGDMKMKWIAEDGEFDFDSTMNFDFDVKDFGNKKVFVVKSGDSEDVKVMNWTSKEGNKMIFNTAPDHRMMFLPETKKENVIDLSDPGIISYEKKEMKDGTEKIVIVRQKPSKEEKEIRKEIIMHSNGPMMMHSGGPVRAKQIKVIAGDDGKVEILEDGKVMHLDELEEGTKVIEKDGKKIVIRKTKEGDEMKVNVEVEENEEQK